MFKVGDKVVVINGIFTGVNGTITTVYRPHHFLYPYEVAHDNCNRVTCFHENELQLQKPTGITSPIAQEVQWQKWPHYSDNSEFQGNYIPVPLEVDFSPKKCECGSSAVGSGMHSDWCCLYEKV